MSSPRRLLIFMHTCNTSHTENVSGDIQSDYECVFCNPADDINVQEDGTSEYKTRAVFTDLLVDAHMAHQLSHALGSGLFSFDIGERFCIHKPDLQRNQRRLPCLEF
jgi:hypothetical protein